MNRTSNGPFIIGGFAGKWSVYILEKSSIILQIRNIPHVRMYTQFVLEYHHTTTNQIFLMRPKKI